MAKVKKGEIYRYRTGQYVREKLGECKGPYRLVNIPKPGRKLLVSIGEKEGPRGGTTKVCALLRHKSTDKGKALWGSAKVVSQQRHRKPSKKARGRGR
ncbi:MAG: hypothetical protein QW815_04285 [Nitrososphaerota archaeon]